MTAEAGSVDGRTARRERGREAVIEAAVRLVETSGLPTAADLARESGVSTSSIFRYFDGVADIEAAVAERFYDKHRELFEAAPPADAGRRERIEQFVDVRLTMFEVFGLTLLRARADTLANNERRPHLDAMRHAVAEQVGRFFGRELADETPARRADLVVAIDTVTAVGSGAIMSEVHGRSPSQIRRAWRLAVDRLLGTEAAA